MERRKAKPAQRLLQSRSGVASMAGVCTLIICACSIALEPLRLLGPLGVPRRVLLRAGEPSCTSCSSCTSCHRAASPPSGATGATGATEATGRARLCLLLGLLRPLRPLGVLCWLRGGSFVAVAASRPVRPVRRVCPGRPVCRVRRVSARFAEPSGAGYSQR